MRFLIFPCITTLGVYFLNRYCYGRKMSFLFYCILFCIFFTISTLAQAFCDDHNPYNKVERFLTQNERDFFFDMTVKYTRKGFHSLEKAEECSIFIPESDKRDLTKNCIRNLIATIALKDIKAKFVIVALAFLATYLEGVYDAWDDINYYMNESNENFELADFYQDILFFDTINKELNK